MTAGGLNDGVRLGGERHSHPDPPGEKLDEHAVGERDGQRGERAGAAREFEMARGELVPRRIIDQRPGDAAGQPQPAQLVLLGAPLVTERAQRDLQRWRPRSVALPGDEGEPVQQQITGTGGGLPVSGQDGGGDLARVASTHQAVGRESSRECLEVCLAREPGIQRFEPLGRIEQQGGSIATPRHREGDLRVQQLGARLLELVQRSCLGHRQQPQRRVACPGPMLAHRGEKRTLCPAPRVGRQFDGARVKCRPGRQAASRPRSAGRALQLGGDVLVEADRRVRAMPGAAIGVDVGVGGFGQRPMDALSLLRRCRALDRRTHERMTEAHLRAQID